MLFNPRGSVRNTCAWQKMVRSMMYWKYTQINWEYRATLDKTGLATEKRGLATKNSNCLTYSAYFYSSLCRQKILLTTHGMIQQPLGSPVWYWRFEACSQVKVLISPVLYSSLLAILLHRSSCSYRRYIFLWIGHFRHWFIKHQLLNYKHFCFSFKWA
jgi:hypothetical protein